MLNPNPVKSKDWIFDINMSVGNYDRRNYFVDGFSIWYMREIPQIKVDNIFYTYVKNFNGFGLVFDTYQVTQDMPAGTNKILAVSNDGTKDDFNPYKDYMSICNGKYRTHLMVDIRMKYVDQNFQLFFKAPEDANYQLCMEIPQINLDYDGYLIFVSSTGDPYSDFHLVNSIKAFNPKGKSTDSIKQFESNRRVQHFNFSDVADDTLHKYGEKRPITKADVVEKVNQEGYSI
jgi:hypothetical protein